MPVAVIAGGIATRIRPVTEKIPKSMIDIMGRPFIDHQLELLRSGGFDSVVLCVGFLGGMIEGHVGDGRRFGLRVRYSFDGDSPLGTGGAVKKALPLLGDRFFVLYGDSYLPIKYAEVESAFLASGQPGLMTVYRNGGKWDTSNIVYSPDGERVGAVTLYDKENRVPEMDYIDYGISCLRASEILREQRAAFDLADVLSGLSRQGRLAGFEVLTRFYEIGSFAGIEDFRRYIANRKKDRC
jgi:NDP-sugar pyrophosphorylase family protein